MTKEKKMENITQENYELYFFRYHEGLLSREEREAVERFVALHADLREDFELYDASFRLPAGEPVVMADKSRLMPPTAGAGWRLASARWRWTAAAVLATAVGVGAWLWTGLDEPTAVAKRGEPTSDASLVVTDSVAASAATAVAVGFAAGRKSDEVESTTVARHDVLPTDASRPNQPVVAVRPAKRPVEKAEPSPMAASAGEAVAENVAAEPPTDSVLYVDDLVQYVGDAESLAEWMESKAGESVGEAHLFVADTMDEWVWPTEVDTLQLAQSRSRRRLSDLREEQRTRWNMRSRDLMAALTWTEARINSWRRVGAARRQLRQSTEVASADPQM